MKLKVIETAETYRLWKINKKLSVLKSMRAEYKIGLEEYPQDYTEKELEKMRREIKKLDIQIAQLETQL